MIRFSSARNLPFAIALSLLPLAAMAQSPAAAPAVTTGSAAPSASMPALPKDAALKMEEHTRKLHDELAITPAQQPQWDQFAQVMRDNAMAMRQAFSDRGTKFATMNAADNMQSYAELAQIHAANMQKAASAFQTVYATLSPEQKQSADRAFRNEMAHKAAVKRTR